MKLIIFGAGASFDSMHSFHDENSIYNKWKAPLANEIFSDRRNFIDIIKDFKGAESLKSEIMLHNDLEEYFQNLWDFAKENSDNLTFSKILNTQFFLQKLFIEISNNYRSIGNSNYEVISNLAYKYTKVIDEDILFISFNYDLLLDFALEKTLNIGFNEIDDYLKSNIKYIKPHGSCNWFKDLNQVIGPNSVRSFTGTDPAKFVDNLYGKNVSNALIESELMDRIQIKNSVFEKQSYGIPQLLIPLKDKDEFVLPEKHLNYLEENLREVDEILIIGWKGTEANFARLLEKHLSDKNVNILTINNGDKTINAEMKKILPNAEIRSYPYKPDVCHEGNTDTFTNFVKTQVQYRGQSTFFFNTHG